MYCDRSSCGIYHFILHQRGERSGWIYTNHQRRLFEGARIINNIIAGNATISAEDLKDLKETFHLFSFDIMGLKEEKGSSDGREAAYGKVVDMLLEQRMKAKANKDWATSDEIRNTLTALGFEIKDTKDGFEWRLNK